MQMLLGLLMICAGGFYIIRDLRRNVGADPFEGMLIAIAITLAGCGILRTGWDNFEAQREPAPVVQTASAPIE